MSLSVSTYPSAEPITLEEAKNHLNIDLEYTDEDNLIEMYISAARSYCEQYLGYPIAQTAYTYKMNTFGSSEIELPVSKVISVTSITYVDTTQSPNTQTLSTDVYDLDTGVNPPAVFLKYGQSWPSVRGGRNDVVITFSAGFNDSMASPRDLDDRVPQAIKSAIKLIVGDLWLVRETKTDLEIYQNDGAERLLDFFRSRSSTCAV